MVYIGRARPPHIDGYENEEIGFSHASIRELGFNSSSLHPLERSTLGRRGATRRVQAGVRPPGAHAAPAGADTLHEGFGEAA